MTDRIIKNPEFKTHVNKILDEVFRLYNSRGKFHLGKEIDSGQLVWVDLINSLPRQTKKPLEYTLTASEKEELDAVLQTKIGQIIYYEAFQAGR